MGSSITVTMVRISPCRVMKSVIVYMIAGLRTGAPKVAIFEMRRRDLQRVANPLSGGKAGPGVGRPCRRMLTVRPCRSASPATA